MGSARVSKSLPLQVAAVCFRRQGAAVEFLLVNTNGGNKWTFPKGSTDARLSHSQAAEREAAEEAGAVGTIEPRHFHLYIHSKGVFWQPGGVQMNRCAILRGSVRTRPSGGWQRDAK